MDIKKVALKDSGLKGCDVTYSQIEKKDNRSTLAEYTAKKKHPVQLSLERPFKDLRIHLLEICGYVHEGTSKAVINYLLARTEVTSIAFGEGGFILTGTLEVLKGNKQHALKQAVEGEDEYENYEGVAAIVETIVEETQVYLRGDAKVTDEELVIRYVAAGKEKGFDADSFAALPEEEQKRIATDILEKMGAVVIHDDEISKEGEEDLEDVEAEFKDSPEVPIHNEGFAGHETAPEPADEITLTGKEEVLLPAKK